MEYWTSPEKRQREKSGALMLLSGVFSSLLPAVWLN